MAGNIKIEFFFGCDDKVKEIKTEKCFLWGPKFEIFTYDKTYFDLGCLKTKTVSVHTLLYSLYHI